MTKFVSTRYPDLWVHPLGVRFSGGVAEVDDPATAAALAGVRTEGVALAEGETLPGAEVADGGQEQDTGPSDGSPESADDEDQAEEPAPAQQEDTEAAAEAEEPAAVVEPPPISDGKASHVHYAVDVLGLDKAKAQSMTKPDLVDWIRGNRG
ncbi:hypothetical protein ACFQZ2_05495 [Streptomonospora algeriensis]|uniref:Rho termination factor N-terminal domain-containing protein n=1 Tax=Streptomonospora algeriensis TaxID=995084 RepID=A0ABW3B9J9_9ACTN